MPKLEYFLVAESIAIDRMTNHVSVFNIVEELRIPATGDAQIVAMQPSMVALALLRTEPGDEQIDWQALLTITSPGGKTTPATLNFKIKPGDKRHRLFVRLTGYPLESPGDLKFDLQLNGQHLAEHIITVILEGAEGAQKQSD